MSKNKKLTLRLEGTSPGQLSMARLADYLSALSSLYGSKSDVHFDSITEGSARLNAYANNPKVHQEVIKKTIEQLNNNSKPYQKIVEMLTKDGLTAGEIIDGDLVIGVIKPETDPQLITIKKKSKVQGRLYNIGGKDDTIPVKLEGPNGEVLNCETSPQIAVQLSKYLFKYIRVHGNSEWEKKDNVWKLKKLTIERYEELKNTNLRDALLEVNNAPGNNWSEIDDPIEILSKLRSIN